MKKNNFNSLVVCSIEHIKWTDKFGKLFDAIIMNPILGTIPCYRIVYKPFFNPGNNLIDGDNYLIRIHEIELDGFLGRYFKWEMISLLSNEEFEYLKKELKPPKILDIHKNILLDIDQMKRFLKNDKLRFENEVRYFKNKAHINHLKKEIETYEQLATNSGDPYYYSNKIDSINKKILEISNFVYNEIIDE